MLCRGVGLVGEQDGVQQKDILEPISVEFIYSIGSKSKGLHLASIRFKLAGCSAIA